MTKYDFTTAKAGDTIIKEHSITDVYWKVIGVSHTGRVYLDAYRKDDGRFVLTTHTSKDEGGLWDNSVKYTPPVPIDVFYNLYTTGKGEAYVSSHNDSMYIADRNADSTRLGVVKITKTGDKVSVEYIERAGRGDV